MFISNLAIRRPVFTVMVVLAFGVLGVMSCVNLGVDLYPDVNFPVVMVSTFYPGAGPEEVEQLVSKPIEEACSSLNGIDEVRSFSRDSISTVVLQFKLKTDIKDASTQVREKVAAIRSKLPRDIKDPVIARMDPQAIPIMTYAVASKRGPAETRRLTEDVIKPQIEAVDGVASVTITGGLEREVHIYVDRSKLDALGLSLAQIAGQLGADSFDMPGGRITDGASELNVRTLGRFRSVEELSNVVVASLANGSQVRLSDVARVEDGYKEVRTRPLLDGEQAVTFEVQKGSGANTVSVANAIYQRLDETRQVLPKDVEISSVLDMSTFIRRNYNDVKESIIFGGLMAILVIFAFMLDWRSTIISAVSLPISIVTTFFAMWVMGFNFNMMSMMGLSLAIGLLIDDAVVVRENIFRRMEMGEDRVTAAQRGTEQIGLAVMATTFTIVAVFIPVAFTGGVVGMFFRQFGLTIAAAVMVSLFTSFTLDPMLSARVFKPIKPGHLERQRHHRVFGPFVRAYDALDAYYREVLAWALTHKWTVVGSAVAVLCASLALTGLMGSDFMNNGDRGEFKLSVEAPAGTSFQEMERIARDVEVAVRKNPHVKRIYTVVAPSEESNKARMNVYITPKNERPKEPLAVVEDQVRVELRKLPSLRFDITDPNPMDNGGMDKPIYIQVQGENYETLQAYARQVLQVVKSTPGTMDVDMSFRPGKPETSIHVDRARAADLGVSVGTVAQTVRLALEGEVIAKYRQGDRDWDVRLQLAPEDRRSPSTLSALSVPATGRRLNGPMAGPRLARLDELGSLENTTGPATIERYQRQRQILVTGVLSGRSLGEVVDDIKNGLDKIEKPAGYRATFGGQAKNMAETFQNMLIALLIAVLFIYFVLASQFESFVHPLTIMTALPLAIVGALLALFLTGNSISMIAMIGVILLMGLVTKNSILLVDLTNELRDKGLSIKDALLEAGPTRLRPILMTSAAMVLGMMPSALSRGDGSEMRSPMALAVIGGVITSTFLTLIVVPVVYTWMDKLTLRGRRSPETADVLADKLKDMDGQPAPLDVPEIPVASASVPALRRDA
ncbi:MAG: efflux RND transporter permease subunit [Deltaproteobacteria bacterium]|nr:efflux RND transporter permease subunit [Deltaproteobacteria bacterium]